jgi:dihydrofolate reductase
MKKIIIVAKAKNNVIGKDNQLIWKLSDDLKKFKALTSGHHIIMGRKTFESMGKPLPNRTSIVITRNTNYEVPEGHFVVHSLQEAFDLSDQMQQESVFVIGGAEIYEQALSHCDELMITEVNTAPNGDAFFPEFSVKEWKKINEEHFEKNEKNEFDFDFVTYQKIIN